MSKQIKLSSDDILKITEEFQKLLLKGAPNGVVNYSKTLSSITRRAKVVFSDTAWTKMQALIRVFDKEVAWHGVAYRGEDETKDEYYITDILVYPQEVGAATVDMDVVLYEKWICDNIDDERFFNIQMQGHSHVNMSVSPSATDLDHQKEILNDLGDEAFYIFMIWNKSGASNTKIYDMKKNVLFENADIDIVFASEFIEDAKKMVKEYKYTRTNTGGYTYNKIGGSYNSSYYGSTSYESTDISKAPPDKKKDERNDKNSKIIGFQTSSQTSQKIRRKGKRKKDKAKQKDYKHLDTPYYDDYSCY